jgi:ABC-type uncharacterized transport system substrate-binding protein
MRRRQFITLLGGAAAWPLAVRAQQVSRPLVGVLSPLSAIMAARNMSALREGLRELGYVEGRNIALEFRYAEGMPGRMPELAADLVALKPDVIIATPDTGAFAARDATRTIPIVTITLEDPVAIGLISSIRRPDGNITGVWIFGDDALVSKRLELIKEVAPGIVRLGALVNPGDPQDSRMVDFMPVAGRNLGLTLRIYEARTSADLDAAFAASATDGMQALFISQSPLFMTHRAEIAALAERARIPAIYGFREFVAAGGLVSYGASLPGVYRHIATIVDKILRGSKPANLPVDVPTRFELIVNLRAAKLIGLTIPDSFLARADEVIE